MLVEDEILIAMDLEQLLTNQGASVSLAVRLADAFRVYEGLTEGVDLALLDIDLGRETVFPFAEQLQRDGVQIVFHSTSAQFEAAVERFPTALFVEKPSEQQSLFSAMRLRTA